MVVLHHFVLDQLEREDLEIARREMFALVNGQVGEF
jgi:hypothetical protein